MSRVPTTTVYADVRNLTEAQVTALAEAFEAQGFYHEGDYETLFAARWTPCGVRLFNLDALPVVHAILTEN